MISKKDIFYLVSPPAYSRTSKSPSCHLLLAVVISLNILLFVIYIYSWEWLSNTSYKALHSYYFTWFGYSLLTCFFFLISAQYIYCLLLSIVYKRLYSFLESIFSIVCFSSVCHWSIIEHDSLLLQKGFLVLQFHGDKPEFGTTARVICRPTITRIEGKLQLWSIICDRTDFICIWPLKCVYVVECWGCRGWIESQTKLFSKEWIYLFFKKK